MNKEVEIKIKQLIKLLKTEDEVQRLKTIKELEDNPDLLNIKGLTSKGYAEVIKAIKKKVLENDKHTL